MDHPILLIVVSDKNQSADEIITNIRKTANTENVQEYGNSKMYVHNIKTKYYETKIALLPTENIEVLSDDIKNKAEGILIYFDSSDRSFLKSALPLYKDFIQNNNIEFSILLCKELMENISEGITFNCVKSIYNKFDIIELDRKNCDDDTLPDAVGYEELNQALQVFPKIPDFDIANIDNDDENLEDSEDVEHELEKFENLLSQVMQFRPNTINMSRDDRLNYAQNFAEVFEKLILQDDGDLSTD